MGIPFALIQFGGSLIAIGALAWLAARMGLGKAAHLQTEADIAHAANETLDGFEPVEVAIDAQGAAALARDHDGQIILLKSHGNQFAGRLLDGAASAIFEHGALQVDCADYWFGKVSIACDQAQYWEEAINALGHRPDA